jgi:ABC-type glycerol-3-phosphate transport system permease component
VILGKSTQRVYFASLAMTKTEKLFHEVNSMSSNFSKNSSPIGFASLLTPYSNNYVLLMSGAVLSVLPILILFLLFQKAFITGLMIGAVKG